MMERNTKSPKPSIGRRLVTAVASLGVAGLLVTAIAGGTTILHQRAAARVGTVEPTPPLPVASQMLRVEDAYAVIDRYAGRLEPARETPMSFERAGLLLEVAVDEGDRVDAGQVVARLDVEPLLVQRSQLEAERRRSEADLELARLTTERQATLQRQGHASMQRYDEARLGVEATAAAIARIDAAIAAIDIDIAKSEIRAPFAGRVADRFTDEGRVVSAGAPVIHLLESDRAQVRIGVSPDAAAQLAAGDRVVLTSDAVEMPAQVTALRPDLTGGTRTVPVLFELAEPPPLPFGEIVELAVERRVPARGAWLPLAALSEGPKGLWVITTVVAGDAGPVTGREAVEVIHVDDGRAYVRGTFADDTRVVVNGGNRTAPGQRVALLAE